MNKMNVAELKEKCGTCVKKAESVVDTMKDISVRKKFDVCFEVKSKKQQKNIFDFKFNCDKEMTLFKIAACVIAVVAGVAILSSFLNSLTSPSKKKSCSCDCDEI